MHYSKEISSPCWYTYSSECSPFNLVALIKMNIVPINYHPQLKRPGEQKREKLPAVSVMKTCYEMMIGGVIFGILQYKLWVMDQILPWQPQSPSLGGGHSRAPEPTPSTGWGVGNERDERATQLYVEHNQLCPGSVWEHFTLKMDICSLMVIYRENRVCRLHMDTDIWNKRISFF